MRPGRTLFAPERQELLVRRLGETGRIDAAGMAVELGVSTESVRKDLALLEERGLLRRVHGGAIPLHDLRSEPDIRARTAVADEKQAIARAALRHVPPSGSILVDAGTTTARMAELLPANSRLFVCTNSLPIAAALAESSEVTVHALGGTVRRASQAGVGPQTISALAAINVDVAFLGANAVSITRGLTTPDEQEGMTKRAMFAAARRRVLLVDHTKFGLESLHKYAELADLDLIITDAGVSAATIDEVTAAGVEIEIAGKEKMITTVTANPSLDRTLHVATIARGEVHRATSELLEPSGKGVNVSVALHAAGRRTVAVLPVGGPGWTASDRIARRARCSGTDGAHVRRRAQQHFGDREGRNHHEIQRARPVADFG